jgi:predicted TIM-barrel fold metal-dependent hydrolase
MNSVPALFDVNAGFGKPAAGGAEFPTIKDRLDAMDRLGIGRALVWNVEAVQSHALSCNDALLAGIRGTPGASGRVYPALSVSSLMIYEGNGCESLERQMDAFPCRALRFASVFGRLSLMQLEPVMRRVRGRKPFIILAYDQASVADILEFTETFPDIPLVMTNLWWQAGVTVFDLMRRRRSILADTSWMHVFGGIELIVKRFGADRLVFGTGNRSHNGAAIGALARAVITDAERRQIAYENLNRLTGLADSPAAPARPWTANTLWPRFLEGKPLGVDIVDAHGHLGPSGGYILETHEERAQLAAGLKVMDAAGIRTMVVSGLQALLGGPVEGNDLLQSILAPHGGRFLGYLAFNPFYAGELTPRLDAFFTGPVFKGFKTLCDYWQVPITDQRFTPMWEYAERHAMPVLSHTWDGAYDRPGMFADLVERYPNVQFILGHSGGGNDGRAEAEALARARPNVYLEWCGSFCNTVPWEETLRMVDPKQVVFGTDAMMHDINWELGRLLSLDAPDGVLLPILGGNMRRILAMRR